MDSFFARWEEEKGLKIRSLPPFTIASNDPLGKDVFYFKDFSRW
jgi:hypothetical protein